MYWLIFETVNLEYGPALGRVAPLQLVDNGQGAAALLCRLPGIDHLTFIDLLTMGSSNMISVRLYWFINSAYTPFSKTIFQAP